MAVIKKYEAEIISIKNLTSDIFTVEFRSIGSIFKYTPGQFLHLALELYDPSEAWPDSRCFSIQTSPNKESIKITYSIKGTFTYKMSVELRVGKIVSLKLPYGELFQQTHSKNNTVFIAGGTGITPYLSLFTDSSFSNYTNPKLYFGFRNPDYDLFNEELTVANSINTSFEIIKKNEKECGVLDISGIFLENKNAETFFISGPQTMIKSFKDNLIKFGIPQANIKTDEWE